MKEGQIDSPRPPKEKLPSKIPALLGLTINTPNDINDVILGFLLLTLNRLHILFWCFHCWLWTRKGRLENFIYSRLRSIRWWSAINSSFSKIYIFRYGYSPTIWSKNVRGYLKFSDQTFCGNRINSQIQTSRLRNIWYNSVLHNLRTRKFQWIFQWIVILLL